MIIAKEDIRRKFSRASGTYEQKAAVQSQMARQLISYLEKKEYDSVLEVGCGTGYLSSLLIQNFRINKLILNDISESMLSYCRAKFSCITSVDYLFFYHVFFCFFLFGLFDYYYYLYYYYCYC